MRILIFSAFDPIPSDGAEIIRYARLANIFIALGHKVTYVTSSFFHLKKSNRKPFWDDGVHPDLTLKLLPVPGYKKHIGYKRISSNYQLARQMFIYLNKLDKTDYPDLIITAAPPLRVNNIILNWGRQNKIPAVYDIQDIWPDEFLKFFPSWFPARLMLFSSFRLATKNVALATAVASVSNDYLNHYKDLIANKPHKFFYLGINTSIFKNVAGTGNSLTIIHLGNSQNADYWDSIVTAIASTPNTKLLVAGKAGWPKRILAKFNRLKPAQILVKGLLDREEMADVLASCQCGLVLLDEKSKSAFPNRVFAYWAAGLPIVNNIKNGELEVLIQQYQLGITIRDNSVRTIQEGIEYCLQHFNTEDRKRIQEFARSYCDNSKIYGPYASWALNFTKIYQ